MPKGSPVVYSRGERTPTSALHFHPCLDFSPATAHQLGKSRWRRWEWLSFGDDPEPDRVELGAAASVYDVIKHYDVKEDIGYGGGKQIDQHAGNGNLPGLH